LEWILRDHLRAASLARHVLNEGEELSSSERRKVAGGEALDVAASGALGALSDCLALCGATDAAIEVNGLASKV